MIIPASGGGGKFTILPNSIKDCTNCSLPHDNYDAVIEELKT